MNTEITIGRPAKGIPSLTADTLCDVILSEFGLNCSTHDASAQLSNKHRKMLQRQTDQLKLPLAEQLMALDEPLVVLLPLETEPGVLNICPDGKRDVFAAVAALADFRNAWAKIVPIDSETDALLDLAQTENQPVWLWLDGE